MTEDAEPEPKSRTLLDMEANDLEALAKVIAAKRSPVDRWIMKILAIAALLVTGYVGNLAETGISSVETTSAEVARLTTTTDRLETLLTNADKRIERMDDARAQELAALRAVVQRLERALQMMILKKAVEDAGVGMVQPQWQPDFSPGVGRPTTAALLEHRATIVRQVQAQAVRQFPDMDEDEARVLADKAFGNYVEQVQEQVQEQDE
jgi:hypothetical protein